jgi:hypothetical protein
MLEVLILVAKWPEHNVIKKLFSSSLTLSTNTPVIVPGKMLQLGLTFANKAGA